MPTLALGRFFVDADEAAIVPSRGPRRRRIGGDPDVVGRTVHVDGGPFAIIEVAPRGFRGTSVVPARRATRVDPLTVLCDE